MDDPAYKRLLDHRRIVKDLMEQDGPAALELSYEVVELTAMETAALPRGNLLRRLAAIEQSQRSMALPARVRELGEWLAAEERPGLTRSIDLWLAVMGRKWGLELPTIREYEE